MKYTIRSNVRNGQINRNRNLISDAVKNFEGKEIEITIEKAKKKRSNQQNAFWWGVVIPIMRNAFKMAGNAFSDNDVHELLKLRFLKETVMVNEETGEIIERMKSTTELTTSQYMDLIAEVQRFAIEYFNTEIPNPNENIKIDL